MALIRTLAIVLVVGNLPNLSAQRDGHESKFEVASLKMLDDFRPPRGVSRNDLHQINYLSTTVRRLIAQAYEVPPYQIEGPKWIDSQYYDLVAKLPEGSSRADLRAMLRALLQERLALEVHRDTQPRSVYALTVGNKGAKLTPASDAPRTVTAQRGSSGMSLSPSGHLTFTSSSMAQFSLALSSLLDRPVIDLTGLDGRFDIVLDVNPGDLNGLQKIIPTPAAPGQTATLAPSIFVAVLDLGLKLDSRKIPVERLVIDHIERIPSEN